MDRDAAQGARQHPSGAGIKTILFNVHDDDSVMDRLQIVLSLARACGAHVHCLHVTPIEAYSVVDSFGGTFVNREIVSAFEQQGEKLRAQMESQLRMEDVSWDYEEITGELLPHLVQCAALADLVVTGHEPNEREFGGPAVTLIGDLLAQIRTPLLVTGDAAGEFDPFGPAVVAWNGSYEAANAVRASLPLLKLASKVSVVQFSEQRSRRFPSTTVLEYLSRQGVHAELETKATSIDVDRAIVDFARRRGAGMIVIGAYSHSRAAEFLFGGVTRGLLRSCELPLLLAH
jgi:nucleotide-binding universal stress UspA family protein